MPIRYDVLQEGTLHIRFNNLNHTHIILKRIQSLPPSPLIRPPFTFYYMQ